MHFVNESCGEYGGPSLSANGDGGTSLKWGSSKLSIDYQL